MSHLVTIKSQVADLDCLKSALEEMGLTLKEGGQPRFYYRHSEEGIECTYLIQLPGRYDLGLKKQDDGSYAFVCDSELMTGGFGRGDEGRKLIGENGQKLISEYTWQVALKEASMNNYAASRQDLDNGEVVITLERYK